MTAFLHWTSTGRIFTSLVSDSGKGTILVPPNPSKLWAEEEGKREIAVTGKEEENQKSEIPEPEIPGPTVETEINNPITAATIILPYFESFLVQLGSLRQTYVGYGCNLSNVELYRGSPYVLEVEQTLS
jgi:hypothetical protein